MTEIYKIIKDFPNYSVSNLGNVKSLNKILKPVKTQYGYLQVTLCKGSKRYTRFIHRLVAMSFINNPLSKPYINHIDSNKTNNHINNLEWCTPKENHYHSTIYGNSKPGLKHTRRAVRDKEDIINILSLLIINTPTKEIAEIYGVSTVTIIKTARDAPKLLN